MKKLIKKITKAFAPDSPMWKNRCGGCLFANHTKTYCYKKHQQILLLGCAMLRISRIRIIYRYE